MKIDLCAVAGWQGITRRTPDSHNASKGFSVHYIARYIVPFQMTEINKNKVEYVCNNERVM
jgi:hypothetical protein